MMPLQEAKAKGFPDVKDLLPPLMHTMRAAKFIIIASPKRYTRHPVTLKVVKLPVKGAVMVNHP